MHCIDLLIVAKSRLSYFRLFFIYCQPNDRSALSSQKRLLKSLSLNYRSCWVDVWGGCCCSSGRPTHLGSDRRPGARCRSGSGTRTASARTRSRRSDRRCRIRTRLGCPEGSSTGRRSADRWSPGPWTRRSDLLSSTPARDSSRESAKLLRLRTRYRRGFVN